MKAISAQTGLHTRRAGFLYLSVSAHLQMEIIKIRMFRCEYMVYAVSHRFTLQLKLRPCPHMPLWTHRGKC